ncbi:hypothetical protein ABPG75_010986 [Micractinium tetrahymenae]
MRQLIDVLNSIAGSAARLPSSLPPSSSTGSGGAGRPGSQQAGAAPGGSSSSSMRGSSSSSSFGGALDEADLPPPLSTAAAAALPALRAAEAALEAKLANDAAACVADYMRLHVLNERLGAQRRFRDAEACRGLNRYCDVLPYDNNRVRLGQPAFLGSRDSSSSNISSSAAGGSGGGAPPAGQAARAANGVGHGAAAAAVAVDYINASPLQLSAEEDVPWAYIASQGPLRHTRDAFWQMAVEQRCSAVIMLTNTVERGVQKCAAYFASAPRSAKAFGRFTVSTLSLEQLLPDLERRSLAVKDTQGQGSGPLKRTLDGEPHQQLQQELPGPSQGSSGSSGGGGQAGSASRQRSTTIQHYHYTAWPDHGVPPSPEPLLHLCAELRAAGAHAAPILVHCSAGIGRSGVFCVLDITTRRLLHLLESERAGSAEQVAAAAAKAVDISGLVADLRCMQIEGGAGGEEVKAARRW